MANSFYRYRRVYTKRFQHLTSKRDEKKYFLRKNQW